MRTENVIISGFTAAGKTTHSHLLAGEFGLQYISPSQIFLSMLGKSPIQPREFWVTDEAKSLWSEPQAKRVDCELLTLEETVRAAVFDSMEMSMLHRREAFKIWLESSIESRVMKALVSHRRQAILTSSELQTRLDLKDHLARRRLKQSWGLDLPLDYSGFDLVLDITACIKAPTLMDSFHSVEQVQTLIRPAVGWFLTRDSDFRSQFQLASRAHTAVKVIRCPGDLTVE